MHGMGKTIPELHAMLNLVEKGIPKKALAVLAISQGQIQKPKPQARGKGKNEGKGKSKLAYNPRRINPSRLAHQGLKGIQKLNKGALDLYVGNGNRVAVEAIGSFDLILPSGMLAIVLQKAKQIQDFGPTSGIRASRGTLMMMKHHTMKMHQTMVLQPINQNNNNNNSFLQQPLSQISNSPFFEDSWKIQERISTRKDGVVRILPPVSAAEIHVVEKERKARTILLMAIPRKHSRKRRFHGMNDAKEIWEIPSGLGLEKGYDRFQQLLSQLEAHGAEVSTEDANHNSHDAIRMKEVYKKDWKQEKPSKGDQNDEKRDSFYQDQGAGKKEQNQNSLPSQEHERTVVYLIRGDAPGPLMTFVRLHILRYNLPRKFVFMLCILILEPLSLSFVFRHLAFMSITITFSTMALILKASNQS
ncbi:hypothetical protein Tco_0836704 [Tanacetum coccineum]